MIIKMTIVNRLFDILMLTRPFQGTLLGRVYHGLQSIIKPLGTFWGDNDFRTNWNAVIIAEVLAVGADAQTVSIGIVDQL